MSLTFPENPTEGQVYAVSDTRKFQFQNGKWNSFINSYIDPDSSAGSGASLGTADPLPAGTASPGVATVASREDHVHPQQTVAAAGGVSLVSSDW